MPKKTAVSSTEQKMMAPEFDEQVLFSLERRYLELLDLDRLELAENSASFEYQRDLRLVKVEEVGLDTNWPSGLYQLNMQNILCSLSDPSHNVVGVVSGNEAGSSLCLGVAQRSDRREIHNMNDAAKIIPSLLQGNFHNVKCHSLTADEIKQDVRQPILSATCMAAVTGMPSKRFGQNHDITFQNLDRFMEGMRGKKYTLLTIAEPISLPTVDDMTSRLFNLSSDIHSQVKATIQRSKGSSDTINVGMFGMSGQTTGESTTETTSTGETRMGGGGAMTSGGAAAGALIGTLVCPGVGTLIGSAVGAGIGIVAALVSGAPLSSMSGLATSFTRSVAQTLGIGGMGGYARNWNRSSSVSHEVLNKKAEYAEELCNQYIDRLKTGKSLGFWNMGVYLLCEDETTLQQGVRLLRTQLSGDETHWEPIRSLVSKDIEDVRRDYLLKFTNPRYNLFLYGEQTESLKQSIWGGKLIRICADRMKKDAAELLETLMGRASRKQKELQEQLEKLRKENPESVSEAELSLAWEEVKKANAGHPLGSVMGGVSTPVSTEELAIAFNLPLSEVRGIGVRKSAHFGVNVVPSPCIQGKVKIGALMHKREVLPDAEIMVGTESLTKHCFISGVTGSGKTTTTQGLLLQLHKQGVPFLVMEPAKCEYRNLLHSIPDLQVFTLGDETVSPFRINPFDFERRGGLLTHIDYLKSVFNASFPMYASMPYLLEDAICQVYMDKGWDLGSSTNRYFDISSASADEFYDYLPTLEDLYERIDSIVAEKKYGQQLHMDLSAALRARLSSLLTGSKGLMLNTRRSIPIKDLLHRPVVLELKNLGDDDEKAFMMGLIFMRIYEYLTANVSGNISELKHLIMIEEAHRLLKNTPDHVSSESANMRGKAVESFCNCLSEVRSYGLGVMIADQIPSKLAPDVIKNTNMKIVHKLLASDDRNIVGDSIGLDEDQKRELAFLPPGQAVVLDDQMNKAVLLQVEREESLSCNSPIGNGDLRQHMEGFRSSNAQVFAKLPGCNRSPKISEKLSRLDVRQFNIECYRAVVGFVAGLLAGNSADIRAVVLCSKGLLRSECIKEDEDELSALFIYYADHFFKKLNESRPGRLNHVVRIHKSVVNAWFDLAQLTDENLEAVQCNVRSGLKLVHRNDYYYETLAQWYLAQSDAANNLATQLQAGAMSDNYPVLDEFLSDCALEMLLGESALSDQAICSTKHALLHQILYGNPRAGDIQRLYREYVGGVA